MLGFNFALLVNDIIPIMLKKAGVNYYYTLKMKITLQACSQKQNTQNSNLFFKRHNTWLNLRKYEMSNLFLRLRRQSPQLLGKTLQKLARHY